jgi:hypothetical protein
MPGEVIEALKKQGRWRVDAVASDDKKAIVS